MQESVNGFAKKYDFLKQATILSDTQEITKRFCLYCQQAYGYTSDCMVMI